MTREVARTLSLADQHEWFARQRSRRSVLIGGVAGAGSLVAGTALLSHPAGAAVTPTRLRKSSPLLLTNNTWSNGSGVVPFGRHISFGAEPTSQVNIAWQLSGPVANPFVRIGTSPFGLGEAVPAELKVVTTPWADITDFLDSVPPAAAAAKAPEVQYYAHAALDWLYPGLTYYYTVGHQGYDPSVNELTLGTVSRFTTAPSGPLPFTFTAFGDQGNSYDAVATSNLILAQSPVFHLHAGDVSYAENGGDGLLTDDYDPRAWDSYFTEIEPTASTVP